MDRDENGTQTVDAYPPDPATVDRLLGGAHHDPHSVLGAHPHPDGTVVRVLRPHADEVHVVREGGEGHPLVRVHDAGLFSGVVPGPPSDYRLAVRYDERVDVVDDPYRWLPTLGEIDLHLIGEGRHERLWDVLGAHVRSYETPAGTVTGTSFAVWAPTARGVRVTGDFDGWAGWTHPMRVLGSSGVWELFVPGVGAGTHYKFRVLGQDGRWRDKADPMAFRTEVPPATASVVDVDRHEWADGEWMAARALREAHAEPMSVYEVHLGSWRQGLSYREAAEQLVAYLDETGFTHVELLPVAEHPFGGSWGYQVTSYYAPTARFGEPDDFRWFVDHLHQHGYGVIVDWVPAHFPRDEWALARFDGSPLYEHADPRRGEQPDWGTLVFDFGRKEVRNFLVANALYWLESFHVDGLRVDAVASMLYLDYSRKDGQWLPNEHGGRENLDAVAFLQEVNATVYREHPGVVTIAEESTAWPGVSRPTHLGGLGFGFKWNMGWMHDTLDYTGRDPIYRGYHHNQMTFSLMYAFSENYVLPISHDEVVHGKGSLWERMPGDPWNKAANIRALLAFMWAHPGKQLLFMGQEFGQSREWSEQRSLDWESLADPLHGGLKTMVGDMNRAYRAHPALWTKDVSPEGFSWIDANDTAGNVFSFLRHGVDADGKPTVLACIANFSGSAREDYRVGLPFAGRWREVLNTDAEAYGGSGVGNLGAVEAEQHVWHGRPASARLRLPPSGVLWLAPEPFEGAVRRPRAAVATTPPAVADAAIREQAAAPPAAAEPPVEPVPEGASRPDAVAPGDAPPAGSRNGSAPTAPDPAGPGATAEAEQVDEVDEVDAGSGPVTLASTPLGGDRDDEGPAADDADPQGAGAVVGDPELVAADRRAADGEALEPAEPVLEEPDPAVLDAAAPTSTVAAPDDAPLDPVPSDPGAADVGTLESGAQDAPAPDDATEFPGTDVPAPHAPVAEVPALDAPDPDAPDPDALEPDTAADAPADATAPVGGAGAPAGDATAAPDGSADDDEPELAPSPVDPVAAGADVDTAPAMPDPAADDTVLDDGPGHPATDAEPVLAPATPAGAGAPSAGSPGQGDGAATTLRDPGAAVTGPRDADRSDAQ